MRNTCKGCIYYQYLNNHDRCCHYMIVTGNTRGCTPDKCDKKVLGKAKSKMKDLPFSQLNAIQSPYFGRKIHKC